MDDHSGRARSPSAPQASQSGGARPPAEPFDPLAALTPRREHCRRQPEGRTSVCARPTVAGYSVSSERGSRRKALSPMNRMPF